MNNQNKCSALITMCRQLILVLLIKCFIINGFVIKSTIGKTSTAIPETLVKCYKNNFTSSFPKPPLTMKVLIEIIRKIEIDDKNSLNMRMLATSMLHSVRLDGIQRSPTVLEVEYLVPFRARGIQFNKYQLLVDYLISGEGSLFPEDSVTTSELCVLHEMISNTVHPWERGDERKTCPLTRSMPKNMESLPFEYSSRGEISRCPQESGIVRTGWGTVSPGHLIAGVAAALQKTTVQLSQIIHAINDDQNATRTKTYKTVADVNNVWAATVAGDIAEVIVNQNSENPIVGNAGFWNDTHYPRAHYLTGREWDLTDAELLGGIDGAIIASEINKWTSILDRTRLSQVLEMYYSRKGISYDPTYKACNRESKFSTIWENVDIEQQASSIAKLLQIIGSPAQYIEEEGIDALAEIATSYYKRKAESKMPSFPCDENGDHFNPVEIILVLGGPWSSYDARQMIAEIAEIADVSYYGSKMGVINGQTGKWITNMTGNIIQLYTDLANEEITWPTTLSLSQSLEAVISYYQTKTKLNCDSLKPIGQVILVLTNNARLTEVDYKRTVAAIRSIKNSNPEASIAYATSDSNSETYEMLTTAYSNDFIIKSSNDLQTLMKQIVEKLSNRPGHIANFYCNDSQIHYEKYVTPNVSAFFEINSVYIQKADISVKFKGNGYADLLICAYDVKFAEMKVCKAVTENDVSFNVRDHCSSSSSLSACNVHFSILANNTKFKCAELDCRYPDQARVNIYTSWIERSGSNGPYYVNSSTTLLIVFVIFYIQRTTLLY